MYVENGWLPLNPIYHCFTLGQFRGHGWISKWRIHLSAGCFAIPSYWKYHDPEAIGSKNFPSLLTFTFDGVFFNLIFDLT